MMPELALEWSIDLSETLKSDNRRLTTPTSNVDEFVNHQQFFKKVEKALPGYELTMLNVGEISEILIKFNIKIPERTKRVFRETNTFLNQLKTTLENVADSAENNIFKFRTELEKNIPILDKDCENCKEKLKNDMISDPNADIGKVVKFLINNMIEVNTLYETSITYQH